MASNIDISTPAVVVFFVQFFGYALLNWIIQITCYRWRADRVEEWKAQPGKRKTRIGENAKGGVCWWPLCPSSRDIEERHPLHPILAVVNLTIASLMAAGVAESYVRGFLPLSDESGWTGQHILKTVGWTFFACTYENLVEYVWHRLMHSHFYNFCHRYHHHYKAPAPFDDMMIHPLEAFGYYCILYSPSLFPMPLHSFLAYMFIMGVTGVFDHSGVVFALPEPFKCLYDSSDHDRHHELVDVNFGFPSMLPDVVFGTYHGEMFGRKYHNNTGAKPGWNSHRI